MLAKLSHALRTSTARIISPALLVSCFVVPVRAADDGPVAGAPASAIERPQTTHEAIDVLYGVVARDALGLAAGDVFSLPIDAAPGAAMTITVPVKGRPYVVDLQPHDIRADGYQLLVQHEDGSITSEPPGPLRTMRGTVRGTPNGHVAATIEEDGLHATINLGDSGIFFVEPIGRFVPDANARHIVYENIDVLPGVGDCGVADAAVVEDFDRAPQAGLSSELMGTSGVCVAQLACDADTEFFNTYGSVAATEARITSIINAVNLQYEQQVGLTHQITTIIVRTGSDPYTLTTAEDRLCQFITEWTNNQGSIQRDVAHLFTGVDLFGTTIGIAADIGGTGICNNNGACTGGTYGPRGSYSIAQSNFDSNFGCATDLTAHEMGHLWGAFHCSCSNNTMNSGITCTNSFGASSISSITAYRDTRSCLSGNCASGPLAPANDTCASATIVPCNTTAIVNTSSATPPSGGGADPDLPSGSPSCQWQGTPTNVHNTVWYSFVALDTSIEIQTCATVGIDDTTLALYDGSCGNLVELACSEDVCGASTYMSRICYDGLTPGNTYLVMVGHPGGWASSTPGQVVLELTCPCPDIGPVAGACCLPSGGCSDLETPTSCAAAGGTFEGAGSTCATANCGPATEACCLPNGTCLALTPTDCSAQGGTPQGAGTTCTDTDGDGTADLCDGCPNDPNKTSPGACGCGNPDTDADGNGTPDCNDIGACCVGITCSIETQADCAAMSGLFQGTGSDCSGSPCATGDVDNLATSDQSTTFGTITSGNYLSTHAQDDVAEAIQEEQTNGNPNRRRSRLEHTWTFNVASGSSYTFYVDAYHTPAGDTEGDDFVFSYSTDNSVYTDMLTVTKESDNDTLQSYTFPGDVSGTLYIRVEDLDRTQGNSALDTIFVDEMFVRTSTGPDTTPPGAPANLTASGGDGVVNLDWNDNGDGDLDGYNVYRSLSSGGPYTQLNGPLVTASAFSDTSVTNGTTYYYVVTAVDLAGNESVDSNEAMATPQASGGPALHVDSIVVFTVNVGQGRKRGAADVIVVDQTGAPVSGALVDGGFSGDLNEFVTAITDGSGLAQLRTLSDKKGGVNITFCVTNITHPTLPYDDTANVETCDTN